MKKIILTILFCLFGLCCSKIALAADYKLAWDANTEPELIGYKLYQSTTSGDYPGPGIVTIPAGTETVSITLSNGVWYYVLTAYDQYGNESGFSNEVMIDADVLPPAVPHNLIIVIGQ